MTSPVLRFVCSDPELTPARAHPSDAGVDLRAAEPVTLDPGERALVGTGVSVQVPDGWVGLVCPRSGLAAKQGVTVTNAPGVIDAGYTGEVKVIVQATSERVVLERGERIAQLVVVPCLLGDWVQVDDLDVSERGVGGFGSTGTN